MSGRGILGLLAAVLLLAGVEGLGAGRQDAQRVLGFLAAKGDVRVGQQAAPSGTAFFPGDIITTGGASLAVMNFHSGTVATVSEGGEVTISRDFITPGLSLGRGVLAIRSEGSPGIRIALPGASVVVRGEAGYPALCRVALVGATAGIFADRGRVEIHGKGAPLVLAPGKSIRLEAGRPQVAGQRAGKVSHAIPEEVLQPQGKGAEIALKVSDGVNWEDVVKTLKTGRVRIALEDGSTLNIGARSVMRITKHDAQSQQTEVELQLGRLRGEVVKITKPGGSFQVKTNTAVIGVVGTILTAQALRNLTRVSCVNGTVKVQNLDPAVGGEVTLHAGQSTNVGRGTPPSSPVEAALSETLNEVGQTSAGEPLSGEMNQALQSLGATPGQISLVGMGAQGGAAGAQGAGAVGRLSPNIVNGVATGTGVASAALGGVAISRAGDARDTVGAAGSLLSAAAQTNRQAADAAQAAANTTTDISNGLQDALNQLSPSGPGCGCLP